MKILVVRFRQIGDAILASVICDTLKKSFPDSQVDYVLYDFVAPIFENHPYIDNVISLDKETRDNPLKYMKFVWDISKANYDIVIDIMSTPKSEVFTFFSRKAKFKIGRKKKKRGYTYTHKIPEPKDAVDKCHKFLKMLQPLEDAGYKLNYSSEFVISITDEEKARLRDRMSEAGIDFSKKVAAFAINSRRPEKVYPKEQMKELIKLFLEKNRDYQVVFFYSPDEKEYAINMYNELVSEDLNKDDKNSYSNRIFSNITTKNIRELAMLIKNCDIFVGNEGGPRHLSQGVGIPSYAIFSPGSRKKDWLPYNNSKHLAIEPYDLVLERKLTEDEFKTLSYEDKYKLVTPEKVIERLENFLKGEE